MIRTYREQMGYTPKEAARQAGISYWTWLRLERGEPVSLTTLQRAARVLHQPIARLICTD